MRTPPHHARLNRISIASAVVALAMSGSVALSPLASAQDSTPPASPVASPQATAVVAQNPATVTALMSSEFKQFPAVPMTVRLLRITIAPGAIVPMHTHPGPEFDRVESGVLTAKSTGDAQTFVGGSKDATTLSSNSADLQQGDWILFPAGTGMELTNSGTENAVLLSAVILPVGTGAPVSIKYTDGTPAKDAFTGISFTVLGDGLLPDLPTGTTTVTIDEVNVPSGTDLPGSQGPALYSRIDGNLSFKVDSGNVQVSRSATPGLQPNAIPNQQFTLDAGDAAFFPTGVAATPRSEKEDAVSFFRLSIQPASSLTSPPAVISAIASPTPATTATAGTPVAASGTPASTSGFTEGALVRTTEDGVNMRAEPSVDAEIVNELNANTELKIVGGPEVAGDFTWYQVEIPGESQGGWVAKDFLKAESAAAATPATRPAASPTASPSASPSASPAAAGTPAAGSFKVDEVVITTEDEVRVRPEASISAEATNTIPKGTRLIITGEAVKADKYTWYPVQGVDTDAYTGWVVANYLKLAPAAGT